MGLFDDILAPETSGASSTAAPSRGGGLFGDVLTPDAMPGGGGRPAQITVRPPGPPQPAPSAGQSRDFAEPTTAGSAFGRGLTTGATFNFYDELTGLARAGGLEPDDPDVAHAIKALAIGGYKKLTGSDEEANRLYDEQVAASHKQTEQMAQEQPWPFLTGNVASALAVPALGATRAGTAIAGAAAPLLGRAAPVVGRTVAGGLTGAGFGGLAGLGEAEGTLGERLPAAGTGAAIGGAVGAAAAPAVEGLIAGGGQLAQQAARYIPGLGNVDVRALRAVLGTIPAAERADPLARGRLTQAEVTATPAAAAIDVGGEASRALARWAANASPEARSVLSQFTQNRYDERAPRIINWLNDTFNFPDQAAQQQAIKETARTVNTPNYNRAVAEGRSGIWDEQLAAISKAPAMQQAVKDATVQAQNRSAREILAQPGATLESVSSRWYTPDQKPTLEFWDLVKKQLSDEISVAQRAGRSTQVGELTGLQNALLDKLDSAVPSYKAAREGAEGFFGYGDALGLGASWVSRNADPRQVAREWGTLSAQERKLAQDSFVSTYVQALGAPGGAGVTSLLNQINQSHNARQILNLVLGPRAQELEAMLRVENIMQRAQTEVKGGSTTARQLVELGLGAPAAGGLSAYYSQDPWDATKGLLVAGLALRGRGIDRRVAEKVAEMLTSRDPQVFANGLKVAARNDKVMNWIRGVDQTIGQAGVYATTPGPSSGPAAAPPAAPQ